MRPISRVVAIMMYAMGLSTAANAQAHPRRVLAGIVRGSITHTPVAGALVLVVGLNANAQTDEQGHFLITNAPVRSAEIRAMAIGFRPCSVTIPAGLDSLFLDLQVLEPKPHGPISSAFGRLTNVDGFEIW